MERTAKATGSKRFNEYLQILFAHPIGKRSRIDHAIEQFRVDRLVFQPFIERRGARNRKVGFPQRQRNVGFKLGFGNAFLLEIELIEEAVLVHDLGHVDKRSRPPWNKGNAQTGDRDHLARVKQRRIPYDGSAPIVAKEDGRSTPELIDNGSDVRSQIAN